MADAKTREAVVVSDKMTKTRVVVIERVFRHPRYERVVTRAKRLKAHDESNDCNEGDTVRIVPDRPLSKTKSWKVVEILERAQ